MRTYTGHRILGAHGIESPQCDRCGISMGRELAYKYGRTCSDCRAVINNRPTRGKVANHEAA
jgi:hypothetical protein